MSADSLAGAAALVALESIVIALVCALVLTFILRRPR